jgi:hypothetical protein
MDESESKTTASANAGAPTEPREELARIDRAFLLGADDASQRTGVRRLIKALWDQLAELKDERGKTPALVLEARLNLCAVPEEVPFDRLEGVYELGADRASHRLGLRDLVAQLRERIDAKISRDGFSTELSLDVHTVLLG